MVNAVVWTIVICCLVALAHWATTALATPDPLARVVRVGSVVVAIVVILFLWLGVFGLAPPLAVR
jgi:hypothetical protein